MLSVVCDCVRRREWQFWVGTSGYNYPEWKGSFYPETLPAAKMLPYYAERFSDRRDQLHVLSRAEREDSRRLEPGDARAIQADAEGAQANHARQRGCAIAETACASSLETAATLGPEARRAAVSAAAKPEEGSRALRRVSRDVSAARLRRLRVPPRIVAGRRGLRAPAARNLALASPTARRLSTPVVITADYGYFRLRDEGYTPADIARWGDVIAREDGQAAATSSSTSSTKRKGRGRSSRSGC